MKDQRGGRSSEVAPAILVVDDDLSVIKLCRALLEESGFNVLSADGSSDALKICAQYQGPIDLLLTDLVLPPPGFQLASTSNQFPHVNGFELAIRAARIRNGLRIILMSEHPDRESRGHGIKRESLPFLAKPFEKDHLLSVVREILAQPAPVLTRAGDDQSGQAVDWVD